MTFGIILRRVGCAAVIRRLGVLWLCGMAATGAVPGVAGAVEKVTLLYVHTTTEIDGVPGQGGGLARLAAVVRQERERTGRTVFLLHGGQTLAPSVLSFYDRGAHMIDLLNDIEPDVMAALNRDFHHGEDALMARAFEAGFPIVSSTAVDNATGRPLEGLADSVVLKAGSVRLGVLALTPVRNGSMYPDARARFLPAGAALTEKAAALRTDGADLVVVLTTVSDDTHRAAIAAQAADIVLYEDRNHAFAQGREGRTLFLTMAPQAMQVLALDLSVEGTDGGGPVSWTAEPRVIDTAAVTPDPAIAARVASYRARLGAQLGLRVARLEAPMTTRRERVRQEENAFANAVTDAMRTALDADVALINGGGIRGDRDYDAGTELTRRDIHAELPYPDPVVVIGVTGQALRAALEHGLSTVEQGQGRFPHVSGVRVAADLARPPGARITALTVNGRPVDPDARYRLATVGFLAGGGDGYAMLARAPRITDDRDAEFLSTLVIAAAARTGSIAPRRDGRLTLTAAPAPAAAGQEGK
ncbi:2',3'-cyclic-nucleotide 2'-phosphodiesterase (5'-nucleotidase family) [Azospirillum fermentarium]|uniref:bifunctional metallophosphatase/5'-nucleotidase n=1 Tax=Azospirillum fermentarium TaxID=1233114 RepID=UPI0022279990|nr:5'-nucleotidase C-terminal domain-containing protein [Azospirillum fermentarium]MCW2247326.1 2',3'-cyclic-nucleotide 2'-phosphodiesterase (5'-nucleotidase family) [Azospirillum fermentarium]